MVGILDSAKARLKGMISGPLIASVITKVNLDITNAKCHHRNNQPFEQTFQKNVTDLVQEFLTQSNPFEDRDDILYTAVNKVMMTQPRNKRFRSTCFYNWRESVKKILIRSR